MVDSKGRSLLHLAAERGNTTFWTLLTARPDIDPLLADTEGNTALMVAAASGQAAILSIWLDQIRTAPRQHLDLVLSLQNTRGENLFMLVIKHTSEGTVKAFIAGLNLTVCIDQKDGEGCCALLLLCSLENRWTLVEQLLTNPHLDEVAMDVHPTDRSGHSALALALMERLKADRQWQAAKAKAGALGEERAARQAVDRLWRIVKLLVAKERDLHGLSLTTGRDAGIACIKQQLECNRRIRPPVPEEVLQEFTNLYSVVFRAKKKPEPPPKLEEASATARRPPPLAVSSFQQAINNIYKETQHQQSDKAAAMDSLKLQTTNGDSKANNGKDSQKTNFNDLEFDYYGETVKDTTTKEDVKDINGNTEVYLNGGDHRKPAPATTKAEAGAEAENEPSVEEIRAQWKLKRTNLDEDGVQKKKSEDTFNSEAFFESLLKKHEQAMVGEEEGAGGGDSGELEERLNEEIVWALQQKMQAEQEAQLKEEMKKPAKKLEMSTPVAAAPPKKTETKKPAVKEPAKPVVDNKPTMDSQLADIERKLLAKKKAETASSTAGLVMSTKMREQLQREQEERELRDLENAINEEIRYEGCTKKKLYFFPSNCLLYQLLFYLKCPQSPVFATLENIVSRDFHFD